MSGEHIGSNPIKPCDERSALPLKTLNRSQGVMENLGGQVLRFLAGGEKRKLKERKKELKKNRSLRLYK